MTVSDADRKGRGGPKKEGVFTEANEGNEDGEKGVRSGLIQSRRDSLNGDADAFPFVVFVSVAPPVGETLLLPFFSAVALCFIYSSIHTRS